MKGFKKMNKKGTAMPMEKTVKIIIGVVVLILIIGLIVGFYSTIAGWIRVIPDYSQQDGKEITDVGSDGEVVSESCPNGVVGRLGSPEAVGNSLNQIIYVNDRNNIYSPFYVYNNNIYFGNIVGKSYRPINIKFGSLNNGIVKFDEGVFDLNSEFQLALWKEYFVGDSLYSPEQIAFYAEEFEGATVKSGLFCKSEESGKTVRINEWPEGYGFQDISIDKNIIRSSNGNNVDLNDDFLSSYFDFSSLEHGDIYLKIVRGSKIEKAYAEIYIEIPKKVLGIQVWTSSELIGFVGRDGRILLRKDYYSLYSSSSGEKLQDLHFKGGFSIDKNLEYINDAKGYKAEDIFLMTNLIIDDKDRIVKIFGGSS